MEEDFARLILKTVSRHGNLVLPYVRAAIENLERYLKGKNNKLPVKTETKIQTSYQPEFYASP